MKPEIIFTEKNHKYSSTKDPSTVLISGTKFVGHFEEKFQENIWLPIKAAERVLPEYHTLKREWKDLGLAVDTENFVDILYQLADPEEMAIAVAEIKDEWDTKRTTTSESGTEYHLEKEHGAYERGQEINPYDGKKYPVHEKPKLEGVDNYSLDIKNLEPGYYPELLVHFGRLVGQADRAWVGKDKFGKYIDIGDWKTFERLDKRGFFDKQRKKFKTFKEPIDHIEDCNLNKTALQTSTYLWCMEQHGYQIRYNGFNHYEKLYRLPYYRTEVELMYLNFPWNEY